MENRLREEVGAGEFAASHSCAGFVFPRNKAAQPAAGRERILPPRLIAIGRNRYFSGCCFLEDGPSKSGRCCPTQARKDSSTVTCLELACWLVKPIFELSTFMMFTSKTEIIYRRKVNTF